MKLERIEIHDFKGFHSLNLKLNGKSTVIFGVNGTGKSTILSAINYCFWPWLYRINQAQSTAYRTFEPNLVRHGSSTTKLFCQVNFAEKSYEISRTYIKSKLGKKATSLLNHYQDFADGFKEAFLNDDGDMPIFVNYGTNRAVLDIPLRIRSKHEFSKLTALERAIENQLDFRTFFEWYRNQEDIENEYIRETGDQNYQDRYLKCVRNAVTAILGDVTDLKVKRNPLRMTVKKNNTELSVDLLSDGEKCTLALMGDLARRIAMANPNRENPLEGSGIVLIDEIELHMHPSWQRTILNVLRSVFPNIQFIITTHSPQVLGEVSEEYNLFRLDTAPDGNAEIERIQTYGMDSGSILKQFMHTGDRTRTVVDAIHSFYLAMDEEKLDDAQQILNNLSDTIGEDPELSAMQVQLDMEQI